MANSYALTHSAARERYRWRNSFFNRAAWLRAMTEARNKLTNRSQALQYIEQLSEKGELEAATRRYALIIIDLVRDTGNEELLSCHTQEELSTWVRRDALAWQANLSEEEFAERFEIGHGNAYGCIEQMLSCLNYELVLDLLVSMRQSD